MLPMQRTTLETLVSKFFLICLWEDIYYKDKKFATHIKYTFNAYKKKEKTQTLAQTLP